VNIVTDDAELKKAGLKVTLPRLRILELLESAESPHLSAEGIYKQLLNAGEEVGLATVYRVLTQFEQAGICIRHNFEEGHGVYELTPTHHHDHMVCVETGDIIEFTCDDIERFQETVAKEKGYEIVDHSMVLYVKPLKK
jgi:Fur family ferric uptake transcriptional regulator